MDSFLLVDNQLTSKMQKGSYSENFLRNDT